MLQNSISGCVILSLNRLFLLARCEVCYLTARGTRRRTHEVFVRLFFQLIGGGTAVCLWAVVPRSDGVVDDGGKDARVSLLNTATQQHFKVTNTDDLFIGKNLCQATYLRPYS